MLSVLIADDNIQKAGRVEECLRSFIGEEFLTLRNATNLWDARVEMSTHQFDLLVLDMNIPIRRSEAPKRDGGAFFLAELQNDSASGPHLPANIVGLSEYPELVAEYAEKFHEQLWHLVHYEETSNDWAYKLGKRIEYIVESHYSRERVSHDFDLAIITALESIELAAVLDLPGRWRLREVRGDPTAFRLGTFGPRSRPIRVAAACAGEMGMPAATALAMKMIARFRPRVLAMCGIAAGVKGAFGDVLIADQSWDYGSGKQTIDAPTQKSRFSPAPAPIPIHPLLRAKCSRLAMDGRLRKKIRDGWTGNAPADPPQIRLGPMASGASVVADRSVIEQVVSLNRKVIGIEMEAYGVFVAATVCSEPRPSVLVAKSICDFGDSEKGDEYQAYAAYTSAAFLHAYALAELGAERRVEATSGKGRRRRSAKS